MVQCIIGILLALILLDGSYTLPKTVGCRDVLITSCHLFKRPNLKHFTSCKRQQVWYLISLPKHLSQAVGQNYSTGVDYSDIHFRYIILYINDHFNDNNNFNNIIFFISYSSLLSFLPLTYCSINSLFYVAYVFDFIYTFYRFIIYLTKKTCHFRNKSLYITHSMFKLPNSFIVGLYS